MEERAAARMGVRTPLLPDERLAAMRKLGFRPHGLYLPERPELQDGLKRRVREIGEISAVDERIAKYLALQDECEEWEQKGVPGRWNGQQAVARSPAQIRVVAFGRRGGKTTEATYEAAVQILERPRSVVWAAAPTMLPVGRCFDLILQTLLDRRFEIATKRDTKEEKLIILANGSRVEGVSLESGASHAGAAVDLVIVDEAAQMTQEAFVRVVLPPLADHGGRCLMISSHEGSETFFYEEHQRAARRAGVDPDLWAVFTDSSWEVNFYVFPQGRRSKMISLFESAMDPEEFLEQFGAVAMRSRLLVYPELRERVHVGKYPYEPGHPVLIGADPSGGANPYALAVVQDFEEEIHQIDEIYELGVAMEQIVPMVEQRPWRRDITDMVLDSAWPADIERWCNYGFPAYPVFQKPEIEARFPFFRRLLRDPLAYHHFHREKAAIVLADWGMDPAMYDELSPEDMRKLLIEVEEMLAEQNLSSYDIEALRRCARYRIDERCENTVYELLHYKYMKPVRRDLGLPGKPLKKDDHLCDAIGYLCWQFWRWLDGPAPSGATSTIRAAGGDALTDAERRILQMELDGELPPLKRGFLPYVRSTFGTGTEARQRSLLRAAK